MQKPLTHPCGLPIADKRLPGEEWPKPFDYPIRKYAGMDFDSHTYKLSLLLCQMNTQVLFSKVKVKSKTLQKPISF